MPEDAEDPLMKKMEVDEGICSSSSESSRSSSRTTAETVTSQDHRGSAADLETVEEDPQTRTIRLSPGKTAWIFDCWSR
jgi:hypothetical protein